MGNNATCTISLQSCSGILFPVSGNLKREDSCLAFAVNQPGIDLSMLVYGKLKRVSCTLIEMDKKP